MPQTEDSRINWPFLARQIAGHRCIPLISNRVTFRHLFPKRDLIAEWAAEIGYPFADRINLALVAQYLTVMTDEGQAKSAFLEFVKRQLFDQAKAEASATRLPFLTALAEDLPKLTVTQLAADLGYCNFDPGQANTWQLLANLGLPIYVTTSFHGLMERALLTYGRQPTSAVYCWSERLEPQLPPEYLADPKIKPSKEQPLVFHLYGTDEAYNSMALNEDDFFEFIAKITADLNDRNQEKRTGVPNQVANKLSLTSTSVLLLGYNLYDWDFRIAFRNAIQRMTQRQRELSLLIQFQPGFDHDLDDDVKARIQDYLSNYAKTNHFSIYWGDVRDFLARLNREL